MRIAMFLTLLLFCSPSWGYTYRVHCAGTLNTGFSQDLQPEISKLDLITDDENLNAGIGSSGESFLILDNIVKRDDASAPLETYQVLVDARRKVRDEQPRVVLRINGLEAEAKGAVSLSAGSAKVDCKLSIEMKAI